MRKASVGRKTIETRIRVKLNLDGVGNYKIVCPNGFLNHMLELFSKHSLIDLDLNAVGDTFVDEHHLIEDIGLVLGKAVKKAIGDKKGINRYGFFILPLDDALALSAVDLSGRSFFVLDAEFEREKVGDFATELVYDFFDSFTRNCDCNLQLKILNGRNTHHKIEALFKAFARALRIAVSKDAENKELPSTKGLL